MLWLVALFACGTSTAPPSDPVAVAPSLPAAAPASAPSAQDLVGVVKENVPAAPYTYTRLETANGTEVWAAELDAPPPVGTEVSVSTSLPMKDFHSATLNRDFPLIYFVQALGTPGGQAAAPVAAAPAAVPSAPVAPVEGQQAVAAVWSDRTKLAGQRVTISGTVAKFTPQVMGKNWLHVRDGSGTEGSNDLTVTSGDTAKVGDRVTVVGIVAIDQDFGSGYSYPVLLTEASITVAP